MCTDLHLDWAQFEASNKYYLESRGRSRAGAGHAPARTMIAARGQDDGSRRAESCCTKGPGMTVEKSTIIPTDRSKHRSLHCLVEPTSAAERGGMNPGSQPRVCMFHFCDLSRNDLGLLLMHDVAVATLQAQVAGADYLSRRADTGAPGAYSV